ncbi:bifunctional tRNA (5-methylaminomethyl-2-thiouridine)(34)-methyltransferase MnmD/FAD-dependent 5-carboxymethylaminomethyl-2-thiouridine(34) oxidoreductase MnmC [Chitinimonas sp.]|uniref:bifunctional tRNA (5-methylaminomethyl-2-thiouridine)(34)-methyltransferase MnmD/FAD-dependent 5-carboxymethylaminomethyl-2-thiouridine(34) oxidoreductase MnmC n=1 Tax=Chitinimonas sp. TaxID=1934313 RepID=UPI002F91F9B1
MLALQPAQLAFTEEGIPYSPAFDDIYHSQSGGLAQARNVFLAGNDLPARWQGRSTFTICETGFGLGLSFLATWQAWRADPARSERLHFVSCELHPFTAQDLLHLYERLFQAEPALAELGQQLWAQWPTLLPGLHRIELEQGRVVLTLLLGDALSLLPKLAGQVDAFFLDGFAPSKNPELWQEALYKQFTRLAAEGATLATYTVAGAVRRGLESAGFQVKRLPGFASKRQMLGGTFRGHRVRPQPPADRRAIVVGAGLAGSAIAERLAARGWRITLLEREAEPARGASGNLAGAYRPVVSLDDNLQARLVRASFLFGQRWLGKLPAGIWQRCGALQLARDNAEAARFQQISEEQGWPEDYVRYVDPAEANKLAGAPVEQAGLWFAQGGWVRPRALVAALLAQAGAAVDLRCGVAVERMARQADAWQVYDAAGGLIASAPVLILANAADADRFAPELQLGRDLRYVSHLPRDKAPPVKAVICRAGYLTPWAGEAACLGSSPIRDSDAAAAAANLALLGGMLPCTAEDQTTLLEGRRCTRPGTADRLPVVGPLADAAAFQPKHAGSLHLAPRQAGLYTLTGFGARGLVWSGLMAELLASQIEGEPLPLERELVLALDPARFLARQAC